MLICLTFFIEFCCLFASDRFLFSFLSKKTFYFLMNVDVSYWYIIVRDEVCRGC